MTQANRLTPALEIRQLRKTYANGVEALKGIDLIVHPGDFFALLGANGAGKSTTISLISTLIKKTSGEIIINGYHLEQDTEKAKLSLGIVPQEMNMNVFETCEEILITQAGYYGVPHKIALSRAHAFLKQLGLWDKCTTQLRHLSGGMKRRLMIARALMHEPSLLILDEPSAGVDIEIRRTLWRFLKTINEAGTTIILTTHYLEEAEQLCDQIAIIDEGRIIKNTSMKNLLQALHHQTLIFNVIDPISVLPDLTPFSATQIDANSFELRLDSHRSLNDIFLTLEKHGIQVQSMRNKTNRLEELFWDLTHHAE